MPTLPYVTSACKHTPFLDTSISSRITGVGTLLLAPTCKSSRVIEFPNLCTGGVGQQHGGAARCRRQPVAGAAIASVLCQQRRPHAGRQRDALPAAARAQPPGAQPRAGRVHSGACVPITLPQRSSTGLACFAHICKRECIESMHVLSTDTGTVIACWMRSVVTNMMPCGTIGRVHQVALRFR